MKEVDSRFHPYIKQPIKIEHIKAKELIDYNRIDIIIKIAYLKSLLKNDLNAIAYYEELYLNTIDIFTNGTFSEPGDSDKKSPSDYINQFKEIANSIIENGFNSDIGLIPVSSENIPLDGAHRLAVAYHLNLTLPVVKLKNLNAKYGISYFHKKSQAPMLTYKLINELLKFDDNIRIAIIWPFSKLDRIEQIENIFGEHFIFSTTLKLNSNGVNNLCINAYENETWIGNSKNEWDGSWNKSSKTFIHGYSTHIVLYKSLSAHDDIELKNKFRKEYKNSKHCIHTTDNKNETLKISQITFFPESEKYLNNINIRKLKIIYEFIEKNNIEKDKVIITGSSLLDLLGLRKANDIDYLIIGNTHKPQDCILNNLLENSHNKYSHHYRSSLESLFNNKENTFRFLNINFLSIDNIYYFKSKRLEGKDIDDLKLIDIFLNGRFGYKLKAIKLKRNSIQYIQRKKVFIINLTVIILRKIGLYDAIKRILKK